MTDFQCGSCYASWSEPQTIQFDKLPANDKLIAIYIQSTAAPSAGTAASLCACPEAAGDVIERDFSSLIIAEGTVTADFVLIVK
jgi:hypothetical protein